MMVGCANIFARRRVRLMLVCIVLKRLHVGSAKNQILLQQMLYIYGGLCLLSVLCAA